MSQDGLQSAQDIIYDFTTYARRKLYKFASCTVFTRSGNDRVEVYLDEIAAAALDVKHRVMHEFGLNENDVSVPAELLIPAIIPTMIADAVVHEWLHHEVGLDEKPTCFASEQLRRALLDESWPYIPKTIAHMVWSHVVCPLRKDKSLVEGQVTFDDCLECYDDKKSSDCPVWELRKALLWSRSTQDGVYHVTEITNPRRAYFERIHDYSQRWDDRWDLFIGSAFHEKTQLNYPAHYREIFVWKDYQRGDEKARLVGHIDAYDAKQNIIIENKTWATLDYSFDRADPEEDHAFQGQTYIMLAESCTRWLRPTKIRFAYIAKTKSRRKLARYKEFLRDPNPPSDVEERVWDLHNALKAKMPPPRRCTTYICKMCPHIYVCAEEYEARVVLEYLEGPDGLRQIIKRRETDEQDGGEEPKPARYAKSDVQFQSYLAQHARGVVMIAKWLQAQGREITIADHVKSTKIEKDPGKKGSWAGHYDIHDKTQDTKIDVKTTNSREIWFESTRLEACLEEPILLYYVFLKEKPLTVRKVWTDKLWQERRNARRKQNHSREWCYIFKPDIAELIEADWEKFKEEPEKQ